MNDAQNSIEDLRPVGTVFESDHFQMGGTPGWIGEWKVVRHILADVPDGPMWMEQVELVRMKQDEIDDIAGSWGYSFAIPISTSIPESGIDWSFPRKE